MILNTGKTLLFGLLILIFSSCSSSEDQEEKGVIEQNTDKIAQEGIDYIKKPIDQAKIAKELAESHSRAVEEAVKKQ